MTENLHAHQQAAERKPVRLVGVVRVQSLCALAHPVDTHEFQVTAVGAVVQLGVHTYPQTFPMLQLLVSPLAPCAAVYTHKPARQLAGQHGQALMDDSSLHLLGWSSDTVYTYKQMPAPKAQRPALRRGHRQPTRCVYTHKQQLPNPAPSGVRCVWGLTTGEPT